MKISRERNFQTETSSVSKMGVKSKPEVQRRYRSTCHSCVRGGRRRRYGGAERGTALHPGLPWTPGETCKYRCHVQDQAWGFSEGPLGMLRGSQDSRGWGMHPREELGLTPGTTGSTAGFKGHLCLMLLEHTGC